MAIFEFVLGTVFTIGLDKLTSNSERLPIIWFLILFPILVFLGFSYIVIFIPRHLYGPGDYRDDNGFLKATAKEFEKNINKEVNEIGNSVNAIINDPKIGKVSSKQVAQKIEAAQLIGIGAAEKYLGIILKQDMKYKTRSGENIYIDGYGIKDGHLFLVEIKMTGDEAWRGQVERGIAQLRTEITHIGVELSEVSLLLVVLLLKKSNEIEEKIKDYVHEIAPFIECLVVDYPESKDKFST